MKKILAISAIVLICFGAKSQNKEIKKIISTAKRDSTDKTCKLLFDDFYNSFESDEGLVNPKFTSAMMKLVTLKSDTSSVNNYLLVFIQRYIDSISEPKKALVWIRALKKEYPKVYGNIHPLILLYEGESLINDGQTDEAYKHFMNFHESYHNSVMSLVYIFKIERDKNLAKTWLSALKSLHPDHWVVKTLK
jgi:hypothetical protein